MREVRVEMCRTHRFPHDGRRSQYGLRKPGIPSILTLIPVCNEDVLFLGGSDVGKGLKPTAFSFQPSAAVG